MEVDTLTELMPRSSQNQVGALAVPVRRVGDNGPAVQRAARSWCSPRQRRLLFMAISTALSTGLGTIITWPTQAQPAVQCFYAKESGLLQGQSIVTTAVLEQVDRAERCWVRIAGSYNTVTSGEIIGLEGKGTVEMFLVTCSYAERRVCFALQSR